MITVEMTDKSFNITEAYKGVMESLIDDAKKNPRYNADTTASIKLISVSLNAKGIWRLVFMADVSTGETEI